MITLNLTANTPEEKIVLEHLIPQVSEELAEKINNGVRIQKDGKTVINKKTLTTFMSFAMEQAKKQIEESKRKGTQAVCVDGKDIMSWCIHYFEEDSIEGTLYNEDGTEYKPPKPQPKTTPSSTISSYTPPAPKPKPQISIFDMFTETAEEKSSEDANKAAITPTISATEKKKQPSPAYQAYFNLVEKYKGYLVLLRLGDFYEAFGDHAKTLASELNLTLTGRDVGLDERVPMTGIPYDAVNNYVNKLADRGYRVALADDLDTVLEIKPFDECEDAEDMTEEEMKEFDSYVDDEPEELLTVSKIVGPSDEDETDDGNEILDAESAKAFDKEAMCVIFELFDNEITLA